MQTVDEAEEVAVTVGCHAVGTAGHVNVGLGVGIAAEFRQHIGPGFNVVDHAVVPAIVQRPAVGKLQAGKAETGPGVRAFFFAGVRLNVVFPLTVAG